MADFDTELQSEAVGRLTYKLIQAILSTPRGLDEKDIHAAWLVAVKMCHLDQQKAAEYLDQETKERLGVPV